MRNGARRVIIRLMKNFEEVEHIADCALRVRGRDLGELLLNAAQGMARLLASDPGSLSLYVEHQFEIEAFDAESLLVDWLNELVYWAETEMLVFHEFDIRHVTPTCLLVNCRGAYSRVIEEHIKAVTYHNLEIVQTDFGLEATVVFDV